MQWVVCWISNKFQASASFLSLCKWSKTQFSIEVNLTKPMVCLDNDGQCNAGKMQECVRVWWQHVWPFSCALVCFCRGLTVWGRTLRWDATACGGKTGTTMKQSKEIPLVLVGPNLLTVPPHRYSVKYRWELHNIFIMYTVMQKPHIPQKDSHISLHTHHPIPSRGLIALQLCSSGINLCFECSSAVINTVYICYNNHQLSFIFCSGKSASIQTARISQN